MLKFEHYVEPVDNEPLFAASPVESSEMDITPMIDITFLLLIFFIVSSKLEEEAPIELPPARHGTAVTLKSSAILTVTKGDGERALVYKGDGENQATLVTSNDLDEQEAEIVEYLTQQVDEGKIYVLIKAEKGVKHGEVARVSRAVGKVESDSAGSLYVAVIETQ